jgi:hypothetical protein
VLAEQLRKHERCGLVERPPSRQAHHRSRATPAWRELRLTWRPHPRLLARRKIFSGCSRVQRKSGGGSYFVPP